ncbi:uncharacterized protein LOC125868571 [Solanum stenotomum]|uniref:uncharacterized protein LOC125868571 n=1 Tax=Solanum stenotomum TaxID=172797 RepID=UPI0020D17536|nr:uncharacterized protein LOC125868571 [Solanum stenotomum]
MKGVIRLRRKGKLSSRFNDNVEILSSVAEVAYNLALPLSLSVVHLMFHVSMLRKYLSDESHVLSPDSVELGLDLSFEEDHILMLDGQVRKLRTKEIALVKVQWKHRSFYNPLLRGTWFTLAMVA